MSDFHHTPSGAAPPRIGGIGAILVGITVLATLVGCGGSDSSGDDSAQPERVIRPAGTNPVDPVAKAEVFRDVSQEAGVEFRHVHGGSGEKYFPETMGGGAAWLDYDSDGWLDLFVVQSGAMPGYQGPDPGGHRLFRNRGDGTFAEVPGAAGASQTPYGMGAFAADYDNDGDPDLLVTAFGENQLFRNDSGQFVNATRRMGVGDDRWSAGAAWGDLDQDGDLDLYVVNYVDFTMENHKLCTPPAPRAYCHPDSYKGVPDRLYRNDGRRFTDITAAAGIEFDEDLAADAKGLGVVWSDLDQDGDLDIYVANDSTRNYLFENLGNGKVRDIAERSGTAYDSTGKPQAGMGIDVGDIDGDTNRDLVVTNMSFETNSYYLSQGSGFFMDVAQQIPAGAKGWVPVGFGLGLIDYDRDSHLDLFVVNGHVTDNIRSHTPNQDYPQPNQLFQGTGTRELFRDVSDRAGVAVTKPLVSRGAAFADYDNDGDLDAYVVNSNQVGQLLKNEAAGGHWVSFLLTGSKGSPRDATGTTVTIEAGGKIQMRELQAGSSYLSTNDPRLNFGLGEATRVDKVEIAWPSGTKQTFEGVEGDRFYSVLEGRPQLIATEPGQPVLPASATD